VKHFALSDEIRHDDYYKRFQGQNVTISVYNWEDYIADGSGGGFDTVSEFESLTGITVNYRTYKTNEELYAALVGGEVSYDVVFPSDYMVHRLIDEARLEKLDYGNIPHFGYISEKYRNLPYDSGNDYSVPYKWGTVALIYNKRYVAEPVDSWAILWDERYKGKIAMMDSPRDTFGIALKRLGYSMNTTDEAEIMGAYRLLIEQRPLVSGYYMDEIYGLMNSGKAYIAPYYAGDAYRMMLDNPDLAVVYPREGGNLFVDAMCIPAGSARKEAAEMFINFMSDPLVAAVNSEHTGYSTPNDLAYWYLSDHLKYNDLVYPPADTLDNTEMLLRLPDDVTALQARLWEEITADSFSAGARIGGTFGAALALALAAILLRLALRRARQGGRAGAKRKKAGRFYWNTALAFVASFALMSAVCVFYVYNKVRVETMSMTNLLTEKSHYTGETLARYMHKAQAIGIFAADGYGAEEFYELARMLFDDAYIRNISIAPQGVIQDVYPLEGFESLVGLDLINRRQGSHEILQAIETGNAILTGPFQSELDDMILAGRVPVFAEGIGGEREFWGIVSISIIYPGVLDGVGFDDFNSQGFDYKIWRISPDDGQAQTIYGGAIEDMSSNRYIEERMNFYDTDWYFRVYSLRPWYSNYDVWLLVAGSLGLCALITMLAQSHNKTRKMEKDLQRLTGALINMSVKFLSEANRPFNDILTEEARNLSKIADIDKFSIWRHTAEQPDTAPLITRIFKWDKDAGEVTETEEQREDIPYDKLFPGWHGLLLKNEVINKPVRELGAVSKAAFEKVGVVSLLATPIFINNTLWGFVNYMDCRGERVFSGDHARFLRSAALLFANAIIRNDMETEIFHAEELSRIKSSFLASMSHEIRTPMNAVIGMSELLSKEKLTERQRQYVGDIWSSATSLLAIINDILDISKIEAGKFELLPVHYNLTAMLENVQSIFRIMAQKKGIDFILEIKDGVPAYLYGDDIRLKQVVVNLCGNAVKFTESGYVKLQVSSSGESVIIKVADTGSGISEQALEGIFDPFTQADKKKNRHITGTGLGLPISKQFIELMGGEVSVQSTVGKGSEFTVSIPKVCGDEAQVSSAASDTEPFYAPAASVLVTDDNELNLKVASGFLKMYGITADTASSGEEALQKVREKAYDMVFMDHMMPGMDGVETTKAIRALGGNFETLTVVALTANSLVGSEEVFLSNGLNDYMPKPIEARKLAEVLGRWIPADKIEARPAEGETAAESGDFLTALAAIPAINPEKGMNNFFRKEDLYKETLELFSNRAIGECEAMGGFLDKGDIGRFAISIHAMKTSLLTLGASELSVLAYEMEARGKAGDADHCREHYPPFAKQVADLTRRLKKLFAPNEAEGGHPKKSAAFLLENLRRFAAAADDLDTDAGIAILTELCAHDWGGVIALQLQGALEAVKGFDCDAALEKTRKVALLCE
jgi:signal transduction histidine kinase/spermidine/putrescine-binding protein/FixJ family two-component response regulator/HPt (histidine-containing phosphotransfer) domain-containing protein